MIELFAGILFVVLFPFAVFWLVRIVRGMF